MRKTAKSQFKLSIFQFYDLPREIQIEYFRNFFPVNSQSKPFNRPENYLNGTDPVWKHNCDRRPEIFGTQ